VGKIAPAATISEEIKDGIENFTHVGGTWASTGVNGQKCFNDSLLGIGQVGCIGLPCLCGTVVHESVPPFR